MRSNNHRSAGTVFLVSIVVVTLVLTFIGAGNATVTAQEPNQWSPDEQVPDTLHDTFTPYMIEDQNRTVHVFTNQWVGDDNQQLAIVYRQWNLEGGWTTPVDILLAPFGQARVQGAYLDQTGTLHLIFWGGEDQQANIYYTRAPAALAERAPTWSRPEPVGQQAIAPSSAALAGDNKGNLVIIYTGDIDRNGIYTVQSSDSGNSWTEPRCIFLAYDADLVPFSLQLYTGPTGQVHAVWNVVSSLGVDISAHYAWLDFNSGQWSEPFLLEERVETEGYFGPSFPSIVDNGQDVVVMYNSGKHSPGGPVGVGRPVQTMRLSSDGGRTWWDPIQPFPQHLGRSGEHSLVVDSDSVLHALFIQRIEQSVDGKYTMIGGVWHSELRGGRWSEPVRFTTDVPPHDIRAVISQGNVLLAAWREDPGTGQSGIWYSFTTLNAPELPGVPLPTPPATPTATPRPTPTPHSLKPLPPHRPASVSQEALPAKASDSPALPLALGLVPVVLLVVGIIIVQQSQFYRGH